MTFQDYQRQNIDISTLPLKLLMGIDIKTIEEQKRVQELVDQRRRFLPVARPANLKGEQGTVTDFRTVEQEKAFQAVIDARVASQRVFMADENSEVPVVETPVVETPVVEAPVETPETVVDTPTAPSEELSAKEGELKMKIKKLKKQVNKLKAKVA